jgi:ELWxxDGT repeat protein
MTHRVVPAIAERLEPRRLLASAKLVEDIIPGAATAVSLGTDQYVAVGSKLFFTAVDATHGEEVWVTDSTGTHITKDVDPGAHPGHATQLTAGDGVVYFVANQGTTTQIWQSNGTDKGTRQVSTLTTADGYPQGLHFLNNNLIFFTGISNTPGAYRLNPTGGQTKIGDGLLGAYLHQVVGNKLYYGAAQVGSTDKALWVTDGNTTQQIRTFKFIGINAGALGNQLIFDAFEDVSFSEPWQSRGSAGTTSLLKDINITGNSSPQNFTAVGSICYFIADSGATDAGFQIYSTDGAAVTRVTKLAGTTASGNLRDLTNFNGTLYFTYAKPGQKRLLYKFDGKALALVGSTAGPTNPGYLTPVGKNLYFSALDAAGKARLYSTDGTTISLVTGDAGTDPASLVNVNGTLYFQATDPAHGGEIRAVEGADIPTGQFTVKFGATKTTIKEGESITFNAKTTPKGKYKYEWDFDGDGTLDGDKKKDNTSVVTHRYPDNFEKGKNVTRSVRVKVTDLATGSIISKKIAITVNNEKPKVALNAFIYTVTYAPTVITGRVTDPGDKEDLTVTVNWDDGSVIPITPDKAGNFTAFHFFTETRFTGREVKVTARDKDGGKKDAKKRIFVDNVLPNGLPEPVDAALGKIGKWIGGTTGNDKVIVQPSKVQPPKKKGMSLDVFINNVLKKVKLTQNEPLTIFLGDGKDRLEIADGIRNLVVARGGNGNDTFVLGSGKESIFGDGGADHVINKGKDDKVKA